MDMIHYTIEMKYLCFWLNHKSWFWLRCIWEIPKTKVDIFPKWKIFSKHKILLWKQFYQGCVWYELEQSTNLFYPLHFNSKNKSKILYLDTSLDLEVFLWSLLIILTWSKHDPTSSTSLEYLMWSWCIGSWIKRC